MGKIYKIKTVGMKSRDISSLERLIRIYQTTGRYEQFAVVSEGVADITMVNFDVAAVALPELSDNNVVINAYRKRMPPADTHAIKMPFLGKKVIELLNDIATREVEKNAVDIKIDAGVTEESKQMTAPIDESAENLTAAQKSVPAYQEKVLVVEDSEIVRKGLSMLLKQRNLDVTFAKDAENALEYLAVNNKFGLIFLDVVMPGMDGYKLCKFIKRSKAQKGSRVVMLTSKSSRFDKVRASFCGCDEYLTKPISPKDFLAFIDEHLALHCPVN